MPSPPGVQPIDAWFDGTSVRLREIARETKRAETWFKPSELQTLQICGVSVQRCQLYFRYIYIYMFYVYIYIYIYMLAFPA